MLGGRVLHLAWPHQPGVFSVTERNKTGGKLKLLPGTGSTDVGYNPIALSCIAAADCTVGGLIQEPGFGGLGRWVPFAAAELNGAWGKPQTIPGAARLNPTEQGEIAALSCTAIGQCAAGGGINGRHAFVVTQTRGVWGKAQLVPGIIKLESGGASNLTPLACWRAQHCVGGGYVYEHSALHTVPFLVNEH